LPWRFLPYPFPVGIISIFLVVIKTGDRAGWYSPF